MTSKTTNKFSLDVRERAVRTVRDHGVDHASLWVAISSIAPSTYHVHAARRSDPSRLPARTKRDAGLMPRIAWVFDGNFNMYRVCLILNGVVSMGCRNRVFENAAFCGESA